MNYLASSFFLYIFKQIETDNRSMTRNNMTPRLEINAIKAVSERNNPPSSSSSELVLLLTAALFSFMAMLVTVRSWWLLLPTSCFGEEDALVDDTVVVVGDSVVIVVVVDVARKAGLHYLIFSIFISGFESKQIFDASFA